MDAKPIVLRQPELAGRRLLVTGAGSGIGLATAALLQAHGARLAAVVQDATQAALARDALPGALVMQQDLLDEAGCVTLPGRAADVLGGLDGLACCAGIFFKKGSDDTSAQEWRQTLELNLTSTFLLTRAAIACMRLDGGAAQASVVVVTSQIGLVGHPRGAAYAASKAGLNGMVKSLALEWAPQGIRVNAVGPGPVRTAMVAAVTADPVALAAMEQSIPMGRLGEPNEIAELVSFLLSSRAAFITGQVICADGGFTAQ